MKFLTTISALLGLAAASPLDPEPPLKRATQALQQVTGFGTNPSNTKMYIYVPATLAASPPIIVAIHYCTGTANGYYSGSPYAQLADQKGFIVIYPESPYSGTCWDVSSKSALSHDGGGDSNSIANMVTYALDKYQGDATKVFVTGSSSGAMMTNVMAATYPEMFAAGIAYSGVAAGCFMSASNAVDGWNNSCATGQSTATAAKWASVVTDMYPGYNGTRPKMQIYHGSADTTLAPRNYNETIKQWVGVFGYDENAPVTTQANSPQNGYTTYTYGDHLVGIYAQGVGHTVPIRGADDMKFFGL
ncbi:carbohydrate esterase family 1 protein [Pseudomassariella vexata]|uniref:Carboxylic ester hydrolase n=1 Tax=Pseudomassariella vexata TaxID=1141098 RepID=A0A1Y2EFW6_9PEZI|nr:carbohydrate esterase family 1 protein [Pseudomassariella vexata]ORY70461.1 carbohydrate esterase family 1 protein [Pseudomassariella vexata]